MHKRVENSPPADPLLLTVSQIAECLAVGETTVNKLIYSGELESVKVGRCRRVTKDALQRYIGKIQKRAA